MQLHAAERDLLLAVASHEQEEQWQRLGKMLGTSWSVRDLLDEGSSKTGGQMPAFVDLPLTLAIAPQLLKKLSDDYRNKYRGILRAEAEGHGHVVEVASMDARTAREFYKRFGRQVAAAQPTTE